METNKISFKELEYKYNAEGVDLVDFKKLIEELGPNKVIEVSSWDVYYKRKDSDDRFVRYRKSTEVPELTKKVKTKDSNNWERLEVDLPLDPTRINEEIVTEFVAIDNYEENFRIYKSCFIYFLDDVNFVWYSVYDKNMNEKGRFIEVEVNKDRVNELGSTVSDVLKEYEQKLSVLGINPKNRLKKSLFEIFVK